MEWLHRHRVWLFAVPQDLLHGCLRKRLADWGGESDSEHSFDDSRGVLAYLVVSKWSGADDTFDLRGAAVCVFACTTLSASIGELSLVRLHRSSLTPSLLYRHKGYHP